jgi:hypothetical protein
MIERDSGATNRVHFIGRRFMSDKLIDAARPAKRKDPPNPKKPPIKEPIKNKKPIGDPPAKRQPIH